MKSFVILSWVFVAVYAISEEFQTKMKLKIMDVAAICVPEVGADESDIAEILSRKTPSRREGKCLISCFQKKFGLQAEDGKPNREGTLALLEPLHDDDPDMYTKLIQISLKCGPALSELPIDDHCDMAIEIMNCAINEGRALGVDDPFSLKG